MTFSLRETAAALVAADPLFAHISEDEQEDAARAAYKSAGIKPSDMQISLLVAEALKPVAAPAHQAPAEPPRPRPAPREPAHDVEGSLAVLMAGAGWSDGEIGKISGVTRETVGRWRCGISRELLSTPQRAAIRAAVLSRRAVLDKVP